MNPALLLLLAGLGAQPSPKPRLVCVITVDQLRPDYLDRYREQLNGGLALLLKRGASFTDAYQDHAVDRKSTRLNSSHSQISYAVFCLKKKNIDTDLKCRGNDSTPQTVKRQMPSPEREHIARLPEDVDMSVVTAQCCEHLLT